MSDRIFPSVPFTVKNPTLRHMLADAVENLWSQVLGTTNWRVVGNIISFAAALTDADRSWRDMIDNVRAETFVIHPCPEGREYLKDAFIAVVVHDDWPIPVSEVDKIKTCMAIAPRYFSNITMQDALDTLEGVSVVVDNGVRTNVETPMTSTASKLQDSNEYPL